MGRHTLKTRQTRSAAGHVMIGGVVERGPRWSHWVPIGAETREYRLGKAWMAVCGTLVVPAGPDYTAELQACPDCDQRERGFSHRATCCSEPHP